MTLLQTPEILDLKRPHRDLGDAPKGNADFIEQDGTIFAWSESNCRYERAWWLYVDPKICNDTMRRRVEALRSERGSPDRPGYKQTRRKK